LEEEEHGTLEKDLRNRKILEEEEHVTIKKVEGTENF
jgi:hypothetical protein